MRFLRLSILCFMLCMMGGSLCMKAWADPNVPGSNVTASATVPNPLRLSFDPSGVLYVGNGDNAPSGFMIHRIGVGGSPVVGYGASALFDPDAVLFDASGTISGTSGSILVGRQNVDGVAEGAITMIGPDQNILTLFGPTRAFRNPADMAFDSSGRLLFTDVDPDLRNVLVSSGGFPSVLFTLPSGARPDGIAIDSMDRIFTSATDGKIRIHDAVGNLVNGAFATGLGADISLAFGMGGAGCETELYVIDASGNFLRFDTLGNATLLGIGFVSVTDLAFGPDGAFYVSELSNNRVLRVSTADDADGDGRGDLCDCAPNDPSALSVPADVRNQRWLPDGVKLAWDDEAPNSGTGTSYDVMYGDLSQLGNLGSGSSESCLANDHAATQIIDPTPTPAPGAGWYFLVRARNNCGNGTYGTNSAGQPRQTVICP